MDAVDPDEVGANSRASVRIKPTTPCLAEASWAMFWADFRPIAELVRIIDPPLPPSIRCGVAGLVACHTPVRLMSIMFRHTGSVMSCESAGERPMPALASRDVEPAQLDLLFAPSSNLPGEPGSPVSGELPVMTGTSAGGDPSSRAAPAFHVACLWRGETWCSAISSSPSDSIWESTPCRAA
jgi:hypothetical protein